MPGKNICLDLLTNGYITSYCKFFKTHSKDIDLEKLQKLLVAVEVSYRGSNEYQIIETTTLLAEHFLKQNDYENSLEYYELALAASRRVNVKESHFELDALNQYGLALLQSGNLKNALENFGKARELAISRNNAEREKIVMDYMMQTNKAMAKEAEEQNDFESAITYYQRCLDLVSNFDSALLGEEASRLNFSLGNAFTKVGKLDIAIQYLEIFLAKSNAVVKENEGSVQLLLAECYEYSNNLSQAISYLETFISQTLDPIPRDVESKVCMHLGALYSKQGRFDLSVTYFERHFLLTSGKTGKYTTQIPQQQSPESKISESAEVRSAIVQLGIARANAQMSFLFETVADSNGLQALIKWKDTGSLDDYLPPSHRISGI